MKIDVPKNWPEAITAVRFMAVWSETAKGRAIARAWLERYSHLTEDEYKEKYYDLTGEEMAYD